MLQRNLSTKPELNSEPALKKNWKIWSRCPPPNYLCLEFHYSLSWHKPSLLLKKHLQAPSPLSCLYQPLLLSCLCAGTSLCAIARWPAFRSGWKLIAFPCSRFASTAQFTVQPCKNGAGRRQGRQCSGRNGAHQAGEGCDCCFWQAGWFKLPGRMHETIFSMLKGGETSLHTQRGNEM